MSKQRKRDSCSSSPAYSADGWYWASLREFCTPPRIVEIRRGKGYECGCELSRKASEYLLLDGPLRPSNPLCVKPNSGNDLTSGKVEI
jgi:hypothetical protein